MSRADELRRDRQIADIQAIFAKSARGASATDDYGAVPDDEPARGELSREELSGFGDGFDPPRGSWGARLLAQRRSGAVFLLVAALTAAATAAVTWFLRPATTPAGPAAATIASVDETGDRSAAPAATSGAAPAPSSASASPSPIVVAVVGMVHNPGLVTLPDGARVSDAIAAAGGALPEADLSTINIARKVADGEQIAVGVPGAAPVPDGAGPGPANGAGPGPALVNLNSAGVAELDALPGIGPVIAQRIVDFRQESGPFTSIDQLAEVSGIGPSILAKVKDQVTV